MSPPKPKFTPEPRIWSLTQLAAWFGRTTPWLRERLPRLEEAGFPPRDDLLDGHDAHACNAWADARSGLSAPGQDKVDAQWTEALK